MAGVARGVAAPARERKGDWERTGRGVATVATRLAVLPGEAFSRGVEIGCLCGFVLIGDLGWTRLAGAFRPGGSNPRSALALSRSRVASRSEARAATGGG